jgi:hypothetical protein
MCDAMLAWAQSVGVGIDGAQTWRRCLRVEWKMKDDEG